MRKFLVIITLLLSCLAGVAQTGGRSVYNFLDFSYSPRVTALGGDLISVHDDDPTLLSVNPSYISLRHRNNLALNFTNYFGRTNYASVLYGFQIPKAGTFAAELRYVGYGNFRGADASGIETGTFTANDVALTLGWGRELSKHFSIGADLHLIFCGYEQYNSFGLAVDVAGSYFNDDKRLSMTLLARNIGSELKPFIPGQYRRSPFDLQFALSQKLEHMPLRYHIVLHHLYRWNMNYYGSENPFLETDATTNTLVYPSKAKQFFDNMFRHVNFGVELEFKYFSLMAAYNHNIHQEMKVVARRSMAGFSYGFMLNIKGVRFGFARQQYAIGAAPNCVSLAFNFEELSKNHKEKQARKLQRQE